MKKLFFFLLSFSLLFIAFPYAPSVYAASTCTVTTDPAKVTTDTDHIKTLTITANGLSNATPYVIKISGGIESVDLTGQKFSGGKIVLTDVSAKTMPVSSSGGPVNRNNYSDPTYDPAKDTATFSPGTYTIEVIDRGSGGVLFQEKKCTTTFSVEKGPGNKCAMQFPDGNVKKDQEIKVQLTGLDPKGSYFTYVQKDTQKGPLATPSICKTGAEYAAADGISLGTVKEDGFYYITVWPATSFFGVNAGCSTPSLANPFTGTLYVAPATFGAKIACSGLLIVPGIAIGVGTTQAATLSGFLTFSGAIPSPCTITNGNSSDPHYVCQTALGPIDTNATAFAKQLFGILLSLSGGIALLLIINAGYQIMTSEGNPEKLQAARETITSAIIGLVFIIFSLVILQIIGVDILRIPGLTK